MIIAIDARPLSRPLTGIGRYTYNVLKHLLELGSHHTWLLYSDKPITADLTTFNNVHIKTGNTKSGLMGALYAQFVFSSWARQDNIDIYWSPRHHLPLLLPRKVRKIVTIHDIVWYRYPDTMTTFGKWQERLLTPLSVSKANNILSISNFTKNELISALDINPLKIIVTPLAPTPLDSLINLNSYLPDILVKQSYYLFVGTLEPRKNLGNLLNAFATFSQKQPELKLVIAGKEGWSNYSISQLIKDLKIADKVVILGFISDEELHALYKNCKALLMPSIYEGFGLPAIEALYYSRPVIATKKSAISPSLSSLVINTKNDSAEAILDAMNSLNENKISQIPSKIQNTWVKCASKTLGVLEPKSLS